MTASPAEPPPTPSAAEPELPPPRLYEYVLLGMLLVVAMAVTIGYFAYHGWFTQDVAKSTAYYGIGLPYLGLSGGLFSFSYGWQRGDMARAVRMTFWLCLVSMALIAMVILLLVLLRGGRAPTDEAEAGEESAASASHGSGIGGLLGHAFDDSDYLLGRGSTGWPFGGSVLGQSGSGQQQVEDNQPLVIHCLHCGERYIPAPPKAICPYCGASAFAS